MKNLQNYTGVLYNFSAGDTVHLTNIVATSATLGANNVLAVKESDGSTLNLNFDPKQDLTSKNFVVSSDGNGGTDISVESSSANWLEFGFDPQNTRFNPNEHTLSPSNVSGLVEKWSFTTGNQVHSSPVVVNGVVYVGSGDNNVYALDANTGAKRWIFTAGSIIESIPAVANGVVYIGSRDNNLYALDASTGAKLWSFATGGGVDASPTVVNGVVYVGSYDHNIYAFGL